MPNRRILALGFSVWMLSWHFAPASARADERTEIYTHFTFVAEQIQDQLPLPTVKRGRRLITDLNRTRHTARIDMYFAPRDATAPTFARARYNVQRKNRTWKEIDTGFHIVTFRTSDEYQAIIESATLVSDTRGPVAPGSLDFSETPMPKGALIVSAMEIKGGLPGFLAEVEKLYDESDTKMSSPQVSEMHIAIPEQNFMKNESEFRTQARLSFEYYALEKPGLSIMYRKMLYGIAKTTPLNETDSAELSQLLSLHESSCEADIN